MTGYTTREAVKAAADSKTTARDNTRVDECIAAAVDTVEGQLLRTFIPWTGTRTKDWPSRSSTGNRLYLDADELIAATEVTSAGVVIPAVTGYLLRPDTGPPYSRIELNRAGSASFTTSGTAQRSVAITGTFGYPGTERAVTTTAEALDADELLLDVAGGVGIGVGSLLRIGAEWVAVRGRRMVTTGQTLTAGVAAELTASTLTVADASSFTEGEVVMVDAERMLVQEIAGNSLIVQRAWDGSALAAHLTLAAVWAPRTLVIERGQRGTAAVAHLTAQTVYRWDVPGLVAEYVLAEALVELEQSGAGYARTIGSGESEREASGRGLRDLRQRAHDRYARKRAPR